MNKIRILILFLLTSVSYAGTYTTDDFITKGPRADVRAWLPSGFVTDGSVDYTTEIQVALNAKPSVLYFPAGTYKTGVLEIKANIHIKGDNATLLGSGNGMFNVLTALDKVYIEGFTITWSSATGTIGKQFFWNNNTAAGNTSYGEGTVYNVTDLQIWNNGLSSSRIVANGTTTRAKIYNNRWVHANTVAISPAYIYVSRGAMDDDSGPVWIEDNYFDVYPPAGANKDIIKIGHGISNAVISNNYIKNNTTDSGAQVDVYSGAHKMRFVGNTLINVQLHRKQVKGGQAAAPAIYHYDLIMGNSFQLQDGFDSSVIALYFIGALGTITNNQFILENVSEQSLAIDFDASDVDITFDTDESVAKIISNNIFDMRNAESTSYAIQQQSGAIGSSGGRYTVISGNLQLGGGDFVSGSSQYTIMMGNVWGDSSNATGVSMNAGLNSMAIGNIADTVTPQFYGKDNGNMVTQYMVALADEATPSVLGLGQCVLTGGITTITDLDDGVTGQIVTLLSEHTVTITDGTNMFLDGSANWAMNDSDNLTLICKADNKWYEMGRSDNQAAVLEYLLLETGDYLLLETGDKLKLESSI